ncbi:MAG: precorrin-8X methylmutase, partial [Pseudomonadales bacterium]
MQYDYNPDPQGIEQESFRQIRELTKLDAYDRDGQQVVMRVVHSLGDPDIAQHMRLSQNACAAGRQALANHCPILCDVEMVKQGLTKRMLEQEPLCYLNDPRTTALA